MPTLNLFDDPSFAPGPEPDDPGYVEEPEEKDEPVSVAPPVATATPKPEHAPQPTGPHVNKRTGQATLFGDIDDFTVARQEWQGMPEFIQEDLQPWKSLLVHFESRADMDAFSKLIGQRLTERTKSVWYPEAEIGRYANKRYTEEP